MDVWLAVFCRRFRSFSGFRSSRFCWSIICLLTRPVRTPVPVRPWKRWPASGMSLDRPAVLDSVHPLCRAGAAWRPGFLLSQTDCRHTPDPRRIPYTFALTLGGVFVELVLGLPIGIVSAVGRGRWTDRVGMFVALLGVRLRPFGWDYCSCTGWVT